MNIGWTSLSFMITDDYILGKIIGTVKKRENVY